MLAGGLARRMGGGDKALHPHRRHDHPRSRAGAAAPRNATGIILNANGDPKRFADYGLPVVADSVPDFAGPLAGILAGPRLGGGATRRDVEWMVSVPGDCPFLPDDLVARLHAVRAAAS